MSDVLEFLPGRAQAVAARLVAALGRLVVRWRTTRRAASASSSHPAIGYLLLGIVAIAAACAFDAPLARSISGLPHGIARVFQAMTQLGTSAYMLVIAALIAILATLAAGRGPRRVGAGFQALAERAAYVFVVVALSGIAAQIVKHVVGRARPRFVDTLGPFHFDFLSLTARLASFPSGHATSAFAAAWAIGLFWPPGRPWLFALAGLIAFSRVAVGAHYLSDVVAGACLGMLVAVLLAHAFARRGIALRVGRRGIAPRGELAVREALARWRGNLGTKLPAG
ncbi:MAG: phosphatase PAP2 family protein [Methylobacteriaceae bacterium]|nr:phosphatase PAP2 family protein [Methylobacteriaceae bacterium]